MEPLVKSYLLRHTFAELEDEHGVCARPSANFTKMSLNYDQFLAKSGDTLSGQCRGMVIRPVDQMTSDDWKARRVGEVDVLAWPMNRFYNHGDPAAANIDWSDRNLRVYEKLDGTMIVLYWDPLQSQWCAGTRAVCEADLPIFKGHFEINDMTFSGLFLKALIATREENEGKPLAWAKCRSCGVQRGEAAHPDLLCPANDVSPHEWTVEGPDKVVHLNKELTYVFELTSPWNRVVVQYDVPRVTLLAARHTASGQEVQIETIRMEHVNRPKTWPINNVAALAAFIDSANPAELEGAVVCSTVRGGASFERLKVKNKAWVMSSRAKDMVTVSPRSALEAVILGKVDDIVPLVDKQIAEKLLKMQSAFVTYCASIDANVARFRAETTSRKDYAQLVLASGDWTPAYFNLYENKSRNALEWVQKTCETNKLSPASLDSILSRLVDHGL